MRDRMTTIVIFHGVILSRYTGILSKRETLIVAIFYRLTPPPFI